MATKPVNLAQAEGTPAYQDYLDAQENIKEMLAQRENRLFDPTLLAMAQGFLSPTRTGSFGESLGNVAAAVAPVQAAEEKRNMDMAKMRLELAQQGVQTNIQATRARANADAMKRIMGDETPPVQQVARPVSQPAPQPAPQPTAPSASALPAASDVPVNAPVAPTTPAPAAVGQPPVMPTAQPPMAQPPRAVAPQGSLEPQGVQVFPAMPQKYSDQEKLMAVSMANSGKEPFEIMKELEDMRMKRLHVEKGQVTDKLTGRVYENYDPTPVDTYIHGHGTVKIPTSQARLLGQAKTRDQYDGIAREIMFGLQNQPKDGSPVTPTPRPTTSQAEATAAGLKAESEKAGTGRGERTSTAMNKVEPAIEVRGVAETAKSLANQEGADKVLGIFEKPTIRAALAKMVDEGSFTPVGFRDAMVAANIKFNVAQKPNESKQDYEDRKQEILDRYYQMGTQVARAKFEASTLAKGQGAFSDGERRMFADTTISTKMSVNSINKTADMLIARANFAENLANSLEDSSMSYDKFRRTPEYQKMLKEYEAKLQSIWSGKSASSKSSKPSGRPDLNAAGANVDRQLD
jgi:hypothetical protein